MYPIVSVKIKNIIKQVSTYEKNVPTTHCLSPTTQ
jgi:hypothetical protein